MLQKRETQIANIRSSFYTFSAMSTVFNFWAEISDDQPKNITEEENKKSGTGCKKGCCGSKKKKETVIEKNNEIPKVNKECRKGCCKKKKKKGKILKEIFLFLWKCIYSKIYRFTFRDFYALWVSKWPKVFVYELFTMIKFCRFVRSTRRIDV